MSELKLEDHYQDEPDSHSLYDDDHGGGAHGEEEVWLISYADMMTLLMGFFALMTSMSSFDENKFNAVAEQAAEYFGGEVEQPFGKLSESIEKLVKEKGLEDQVNLEVKKTQLKISFEGTLFFASGDFKLKKDADTLMSELLKILDQEAGEKKFIVEGHTDDLPINRGIVASNWELSSLRANNVARLFEKYKFKKEQILTLGLGETRPIVPHRNPAGEPILENREKNRRVVIKVLNSHPI